MLEVLHDRHAETPFIGEPPLVGPDGTPFHYSADELEHAYTALQWFLESEHTVSRRAILTLGGLLLNNVMLHYIEKPIMDSHYGEADTTIMVPQPFDIARHAGAAGLISPGWGGTNGKNLVTNFRQHKIYQPTFPLGYYQFSRSVTANSIADNGLLYANTLHLKELDAHGVSEGGMIVLTGALKAGRHLRMISLDDAPFDINDARHAFGAKVIALANELGLYYGGLFGKLGVNMLEQVDKDGIHKVFTGWREAVHNTWSGADPRMMDAQMVFMDQAHLHEQRKQFGKIIDRDTVIIVMRTADVASDPVTKDGQSTEKWMEWGTYNGANVIVVLVERPGHANPYAGLAAAKTQMKHALNQMAA